MAEEIPQGDLENPSKTETKDTEFSLTEDEMQKIKYLGKLERRKNKSRARPEVIRSAFSDNMSLEAQIAMQLAFRDTQAMKNKGEGGKKDGEGEGHNSKNNRVKFADEPPPRPDTTCSKYSTYSEMYERRGALRMPCDLTDDSFEPMALRKRALDGTKLHNALEMVELVNADEPPPPPDNNNCRDDEVIDQIAQRNAVEKCLVWMEVLGQDGPKDSSKAITPTSSSAKSKRQKASKDKTQNETAME